MARLLILGSWHSGSNPAQYATAFDRLGHRVVTCGPRFTQEDADRWRSGLLEMRWPPSAQEADEYVQRVLRESPEPDIVTRKGEHVNLDPNGWDAVLSFWQYGETPTLAKHGKAPAAAAYGDTHTGHLDAMVHAAAQHDHVFVQFRRSDMQAFKDAGHKSVHWLPAAANPSIWKPYPDVEKDIDVLFCGSTHPQVHRDRVQLIEYLQANGLDVTVKHAFGDDAARLMARAKVVLNRSLNADLNMRVAEALMAGANLLTDDVDGLHDIGANGLFWAYRTPEGAAHDGRIALNLYKRAMFNAAPAHAAMRDVLSYEARARQILVTLGLEKEDGSSVSGGTREHASVVRGGRAVGVADTHAVGHFGAACGEEGHPIPGAPGQHLGALATLARRAPDGIGWVGQGTHRGNAEAPKDRPRASVVIPAFNRWEECTLPLIRRLLVLWDDTEPEIIVVDDGSTDETSHTHTTHRQYRILHKPNGGFCSAVNYGVRHAKGEYVVILNNDTSPEDGWLQPLLDELEQGAGLVGSLILNMDGSIQAAGLEQQPDGTWRNRVAHNAPENYRRDVPAVMGACFAMRRSTFLRMGGLDESFGNGGCCDVDLALRVRKEGLPVRLRLDSRVRHAEGSTRFHTPGIQEKIAANNSRLLERWGADVRNGNAPGGVRDESHGDQPGLAAPRTLTVVWEGPTDVAEGGSIAVINKHVTDALRVRGVSVFHGFPSIALLTTNGHAPDAHVSHYWPGTDAHRAPNTEAKAWIVVQPWEAGTPPAEWAKTWEHPAFRLLITPSAHSERLFLEAFSELRGRTAVIPNGVDTPVFTPEGDTWKQHSQAYRFLFVGGEIWRKGVDLAYEAWTKAFLPNEAVRFIVKAQGHDTFYKGQTIAAPPGAANLQRVTKDLSSAELASLYRTVDCVVVPSRHEGFGMVALEAMASGKPVIVTDTAPFTEFVPSGAALFVPSDPEQFARAMRYLYEHPDVGRAMGQKGREAALNYSWDRIASRYSEEIRRVVGE